MSSRRTITYLVLALGLLGSLAALALRRPPGPVATSPGRSARGPVPALGLDNAPPHVREFLGRVLAEVPDSGVGVQGYVFRHWERPGKPTHEALGLKALPGVDPRALLARVMDVDGYEGRIAHVAACRSVADPTFVPPGSVRFRQVVGVPGVARVQHELVMIDAGTIRGYRIAYWYLLDEETNALDPKAGARGESNVGAWLAAPGVVGYALSTWPRRDDVNALQWVSLTSGADALARKIVEGNIDGMAAWSRQSE